MKQIIALQEYTDKFISLYQGEIRNIQDSLANKLIEEGIVAEHSDESQGGGDNKNENSVFVVVADLTSGPADEASGFYLNKTYSELNNAVKKDNAILFITKAGNLRPTQFIEYFEYNENNDIVKLGFTNNGTYFKCQIPELDGTKSKWVYDSDSTTNA